MPTVLVVDDEPTVLDFTRFVLAGNGFTVLTATGAAEALHAFAAADGHVDLLITDMLMPVAGGPTLAAHLIALEPSLPVLFVSGFCDEAPRIGDARVGLLQKPFLPQNLLHHVNSLLANQPLRPLSQRWGDLRKRSAELAHECVRLALQYEGLDERIEETMRRSRKLLGQE